MARSLSETRALVVGGTAGIGLASARRLLDAGVRQMVLVGRSETRGQEAAASLSRDFGTRVVFARADAGIPAEISAAVDQAVAEMGRVDFLLSCGGGDPLPRLLHNIPLEEVIPTITNIQAPVLLPARAVLDVMTRQGGGSIVCFASDAGKLATPGETPIGAAMASVMMFCRAMANEAKRNGIRVNCVTPSIVRGTPLYDRLMADPFCGKLFGRAEKLADLGVVEPDDLADLVCFLASPASAKMTAQCISVTGGISAL